MPPQRRKIVPPTTTSKARKKVAVSGRKPEATQVPGAVETPDLTKSEPARDTAADTATDTDTAAAAADTDTADTAADTKAVSGPAASEPTASEPATSGRTNWVPAIVVGAVAVVLVAFAAVAAVKPGTEVDNMAWVDQGASSEVTRAASEGLTALYRYNWETIDEDLESARAFMGPDLQEETQQFLDAIKSGAEQTQTATEVDVMDIGLVRLESDRAELLANMNVSSTRAGVAYDSVMFPIVVNMETLDGRWVVSATELK